ncbi:MAG TPA: hypothetical protein VF525_09140 [Pyrinomonadaceae bacterium]
MSQHLEQIDFSTAAAPEPHAGHVAEPRIYGLFPAQVRGVDSTGTPFHTETLLDNFGAAEFDLRLTVRVESGSQLLIIADIHDATVALHGKVLRAEPQADGAYRLTVAVTHHRFL